MSVKECLKKMGWEDELIDHYLNKSIPNVETTNIIGLGRNYQESSSITLNEDRANGYTKYIYCKNK